MRRSVPVAALVGLVGLFLWPATAGAQKVTRKIFVNVTDAAGAPVAGLTTADFRLSEGGNVREVTRATFNPPMRIVVLVDTSSALNNILNPVRGGLAALLEGLPSGSEVGLVSTGGQLRIRVPPTADRERVAKAAAGIASDTGANAFLDSLLEADRRLLKSAPAWPVFVILTTDAGEMRGEVDVDAFNRFSNDFMARAGTAHAVVVQGASSGIVTEIAKNLAANTRGVLEVLQIANALPNKMTALAARIAADHAAMATRYEVEFTSDAGSGGSGIVVEVARDGARLQLSGVRPF